MFKYKNKSFYNKYFKKVKGFNLVSPFDEVDGGFKGIIESVGTIHPIKIEVDIPRLFPHHKMLFWTNSLYGYPHLIYSKAVDKSWFCLNTPFAESAENQLAFEIDRLRGWIEKMMHKGLPARIDNFILQQSLRFANIYSWEVFENDEYNSEARLIFIGDFANVVKNFSKEGFLNCKRINISDTESRFYAFEKESADLEKIPYIIVEGRCDNPESLESVSAFYGLDDEVWNRLLPKMHIYERCYLDNFQLTEGIVEKLSEIEQDLKEVFIPDEHLFYIKQFLDFLKQTKSKLFTCIDDDFEIKDGDTLQAEELFEKLERYLSREWYFALGIYSGETLNWYLFSTSRNQKYAKRTTYRLGGVDININDYFDINLTRHKACTTDYQHYFGRGAMNKDLSNSNIAIIGVGAIGSILLETLVRGGATKISLWDGDNVEPGNICRSIYTLDDIGKNKAAVCSEYCSKLSPFCKVTPHPYNLYGKINYASQEIIQKELSAFDVIIDCTASNELLHVLSYTLSNVEIISLCITNHAKDLLCLCSNDGNPYYQRKAFLAMIEQDTNNFYAEGTGCYSPTFLATNSNISHLVNMFVSNLYSWYQNHEKAKTVILNSDGQNTNANYLHNYLLEGYDITLTIPDNVCRDIQWIEDSYDYAIGYLLGAYSEDGKQIFVCHAVNSSEAKEALECIFESCEGIIDYIGEIHYSCEEKDTYKNEIFDSLQAKAESKDVNTNNPLLAIRNPEGDISYFLFINNNLCKFKEKF